MLSVILARLREPSSFAGLSVLLSLAGIHVAPEWASVYTQVVGAVAAIAAMVVREGRR